MQRAISIVLLASYLATTLACGGGSGSTLADSGGNGSGGSSSPPSTPSPPPPGSGSFLTTGSALTARSGATATRLNDGRVLVVGGADTSQPAATPALAIAELYLPGSSTFEFTGSLLAARTGHTATLLSNGKVLIAGGRANGESLAGAELYDPASETFSSTGSMGVARAEHTATLLADGRVLMVGGTGGPTGSPELYDPATGLFSATGSLVLDRAFGHTATRLPNGKVLIAGGLDSTEFFLVGTAELYDPASGSFSPTGSMVRSRIGHTAVSMNDGRVLLVGGEGSAITADAEIYDPASGSFAGTGSMGQRRLEPTATLLASGKVLVAGGYAPVTCPNPQPGECADATNTAELYDPVAGTFAPAASMAHSRAGHTSTVLTGGAVLVVGGRNDNSAELFRE